MSFVGHPIAFELFLIAIGITFFMYVLTIIVYFYFNAPLMTQPTRPRNRSHPLTWSDLPLKFDFNFRVHLGAPPPSASRAGLSNF